MGSALDIPEPIRRQIEKRGGMKALAAVLPDADTLSQWAGTFQVLSEPIRLKVLLLLSAQPLCPCVLTNIVGVADSKLSYHLSVLQGAGLIDAEQKGRWLIYTLTERGQKALGIVRGPLADGRCGIDCGFRSP